MLSYVEEWKISTELKNLLLEVRLDPCNLIRSLINKEKGMILKASKSLPCSWGEQPTARASPKEPN